MKFQNRIAAGACLAFLLSVALWTAAFGDAPATEPAATTTRVLAEPTTIPGVTNFAQISPALYRGEQPTAEGFAELKKLGIKTIVSLRSFHDDRDLLKGTGLQYFQIKADAWHPEDEDVARFLKIVRDSANQPVFVHCMQGSDRTGYMVAEYRLVEQGWSVPEAMAEMRHFAFHEIWRDIPAYLEHSDPAKLRAKRDAIDTGKGEIE